jgi:hypothetical protein
MKYFIKASAVLIYLLLLNLSCDNSKTETKAGPSEDGFWEKCAWLSSSEFDKLDQLQRKLIEFANSPKTAHDDFNRYLSILTLKNKSDEDLVSCTEAESDFRQRLMKHFIFLGLSYGEGDYSFIDKPRMASLFELEHFYFIRDFFYNSSYSHANLKLTLYLLGGLITMQASVKMKKGLTTVSDIANAIAQDYNIIKYGRTSIFNQILYERRADLKKYVTNFLNTDYAFANTFEANALAIKPKVYPGFLKDSKPFWPKDYSEVFAELKLPKLSAHVVGLNPSPGGTPLLTGFFAKRNNRTLLLSSGHWSFNKTAAIMVQKNSNPFGANESQLSWINDQFPIFNFSEQLVAPTLRAAGFSEAEIGQLIPRLGNLYTGFKKMHKILPWLDMALATPNDELIRKAQIDRNSIFKLGIFSESGNKARHIISIGAGVTEDLLASDLKATKSAGLKRVHVGLMMFNNFENSYLQRTEQRLITLVPRTLGQVEMLGYRPPPLAMLFNKRCSGSPFFDIKNDQIVGLLQGSYEIDKDPVGMRAVHFFNENLALIDALISHPRDLNSIPEQDLTRMVRTHMFSDGNYRKEIKDAIIRAHGL